MTQLALFGQTETVRSPICCYEKCSRMGRAELGPEVQHEGCVNRSVLCLTCKRTGEISTRRTA